MSAKIIDRGRGPEIEGTRMHSHNALVFTYNNPILI